MFHPFADDPNIFYSHRDPHTLLGTININIVLLIS